MNGSPWLGGSLRHRACWVATAILLALCGPLACSVHDAPPHADPRSAQVPFQRGVSFGGFGPSGLMPADVDSALKKLRRKLHVDSVSIFVTWTQASRTATSIEPGAEAPSDSEVTAAVRAADSRGMQAIVTPHVDVRGGLFRGLIRPASVRAWFTSYRSFVIHFADLAQRAGAAGFVIGTELSSMTNYSARWRRLIADVRRRFHGFITYTANWGMDPQRVSWWGALDAISVSAYYPLVAGARPSVRKLVSAWGPWFSQLQALHRRFAKPLLFGEIGYRTVADTAARPFDSRSGGLYSPVAQADAYAAALHVWYRVSWFRGFEWWLVPPKRSPLPGRGGGDYVPSRLAEAVLGRWYSVPR